MSFHLYVACFMLAQPANDLQFRKTAKGDIEVSAALSAAHQKAIPQGTLTADQGEAWLRLCVLDARTGKPGPAMLGSYRRDQAELVFRPRFGLEPGGVYRATFGPSDRVVIHKDYRPELRNGGKPATVVKIYPTADFLPANQLKFTIHFSQPMRGGQEIFNQIEILDGDGNVIPDVWLTDELWDETGQILVIYIHPGRIKWGVVLREVLGPVLVPERDYTLVIRGVMADANGQKIGKEVRKKFHTSAEDRVRINLNDWKLQAPKAGTSDPLLVQFPKSIEHKSLERSLTIADAKGNAVAGTSSSGKDEKTWSFTPSRAWETQEYRLVVNGRLEDVAGNTPLRPFDMDLQAPVAPPQRLSIPFRPGL